MRCRGVFRAGNNTVGDSITHAGSNAGVYLGFTMKKEGIAGQNRYLFLQHAKVRLRI